MGPRMSDEKDDEINQLMTELQDARAALVAMGQEMKRQKEKHEIEIYQKENEDSHTCFAQDEDGSYYDTGEDCAVCLQTRRMKRYGSSIHDVECVCNDCTYGPYGYPRADY